MKSSKGRGVSGNNKMIIISTFLNQLFMYICNSYLNCPLPWMPCYKFHKHITFLRYIQIWPMRLAGLQRAAYTVYATF